MSATTASASTFHGLTTLHAATPTTEPLRVLIAEGQGLVRAGLRLLLDNQPDLRVTAEAATSEEAVAAARETDPDVVLMDLDLPGRGGVDATRRILAGAPEGERRIVMLMTSQSDDSVFGALRAGATGLLLKDTQPTELLAAVRAVAEGDALLAPAVARRVVADFLTRPERLACMPEELDELTAREREVLRLLARGLTNAEIAEALVVEPSTVKSHVARVLAKLGLRDRVQAVVFAYEIGLIQPSRNPPG